LVKLFLKTKSSDIYIFGFLDFYNLNIFYHKVINLKMSILPADKIRARAKGDGVIEEKVHDQLKIIEHEIKLAIEARGIEVKVEIPTTFGLPSMTNANAQRRIYYYILKAMHTAGYRAKIRSDGGADPMKQKVWIHVKWFDKNDEQEEAYMDRYIKANSFNTPKEVTSGRTVSRRRRTGSKQANNSAKKPI